MYDHYDNIEEMYDYIQQNFYDYGRIDFLPGFTMLWVKECWRGNNISDTEIDPNELLKIIVTELYPPDISHHMLQSINGIMASINSTHKTASRDQLYHFAKVRFETDPKYTYFAEHYYFDKYISGKTASLIRKRTIQ